MYPDTQLYINGQWADATDGATLDVRNPATDTVIGRVARATRTDLEHAVTAAERGLMQWRATPALNRAAVLRQAGHLLRERAATIATLMTLEQGKILVEARGEVERGADTCEWMAGEASRIYGRSIPARAPNISQQVVKDPVGVVAAFSPWNFPINQLVRKVLGALAAGCSIVVKAPEETPACTAAMVQVFADAGVPAGVLNLVFGVPAEISDFLVPHPAVRKVSFTGSTLVGKRLAAQAAQHMKLSTMELGGHAPVLIFADCDVEATARALVGNKFRNAGQSCISPTRLLVERPAFERFVATFIDAAAAIRIGDGLNPATGMGPLANPRRLSAMQALVADAVNCGAVLRLGGKRVGEHGNFFEPTVVTEVPLQARLMNEEPFGPLVPINPFDSLDEAIAEANRLPFGLSAFAFTGSHKTAQAVATRVESGMISINHFGLGHPEAPFGGMKDSGYGFEGGAEAIEGYLQSRFLTFADL